MPSRKLAARKPKAHGVCPHCRSANVTQTASEQGGDAYFCNTCRRWLTAPPRPAASARPAGAGRKKA